jgi:hypothetical protein
MALRGAVVFAIIFMSSNLHGQTKTAVANEPTNTQKQVVDLRAELHRLSEKIISLESAMSAYEYQLKGKQNRQDYISLNLAEHTFQRVDTDTGFFLISVAEAVPYLNGYKLNLNIGNPSYASYSGAKVKVKWGKTYDAPKYTDKSFDEWQKSIQEKEITLTNVLDAGSWNTVEIILIPATTEQLGFVTLSMSTDTVRLIVK